MRVKAAKAFSTKESLRRSSKPDMRNLVLKIILAMALLILPLSVVANSPLNRDAGFDRFKRKMMPKVGHRITVVGVLNLGKLGDWLPFNGCGVYIYAMRDSDIDKMNSHTRFIGHTVTVTGILRY